MNASTPTDRLLSPGTGLVARAPELWLALLFSLGMLGGAYAFQYIGGMAPCQMCHWQRWAHWLVVGMAVLGLVLPQEGAFGRRFWAVMVASGLLASVIIAGFHAGVEYGGWEGPQSCSVGALAPLPTDGDLFGALADGDDVIDCSEPAWSLLGVSMAGWNAILSLGALVLVLASFRRMPR